MSLLKDSMNLASWIGDLRREFHANPELGFSEERTSRRVAEELMDLGLKPETEVAGTGVLARIDGTLPGSVVALRADMDALPIQEVSGRDYGSKNPGIMHACGHDAHTAMLLGAARLLVSNRDSLHGSVLLIFQPAEESIGGASAIVETGFMERHSVEAVFGLHVDPFTPSGTMGINMDRTCASVDNFRVTIKGSKAHGAYPHLGKDAVSIAGYLVTQLQTIVSREIDPLDGAVVTIGSIHGGTAPNIIAGEVKLEGTLRTHTVANRELLATRVSAMADTIASLHGGSAEVEIIGGCPALTNTPELSRMVKSVGEDILGEDNSAWLDKPTMGGEDFSYYIERVPGAFFRLGAWNFSKGKPAAPHTSGFDIDEGCLPYGSALLAGTALRYLKK